MVLLWVLIGLIVGLILIAILQTALDLMGLLVRCIRHLAQAVRRAHLSPTPDR